MPRSRPLAVLTRFGLSLAFLIVPVFLALALKGRAHASPIINTAYVLAFVGMGWFFGLAASLFGLLVAIVVLALIGSGGKSVLPQHLDYAAPLALTFVAVVSSRVAAYRTRVEQVLRTANEALEQRVRERTQDLEHAREWFQITLSSIGDAVIATDAEGKVTLLNSVAQSLTGWTQGDAAGRPLDEVFRIVNETTRATVENPVTRVLREGAVVGLMNHTVLLRRDGREMPIDDSAAPIRGFTGGVAGVVLIFRDVTERRKSERERERLLAETADAHVQAEDQRARLYSLFQQAPIAINILRGPDHVFEFAHPITRERLGADPTGQPVRSASPRTEADGILEILDGVYRSGVAYYGRAVPMPTGGDAAPATERYIDLTVTPWREPDGSIGGVITMSAEVTEQVLHRRAVEAAEAHLRETARLESLGVLAGGIAHDFNNLLVGIIGNASLAAEMLSPESPTRQLLTDVVTASDKAAQLTHQMLAYSGRGNFVLEAADLSAMVREILPLISRAIPSGVSVDLALDSNLSPIECDKSQMQQLVMNLLINAAESCGNQPGQVRVSTSLVAADARRLPPRFGLPPVEPGVFACLEVRDSGSGMTAEVMARIFDPFFTTKFTGRGLGLSAALGIIRAHNGAIQVESTPGLGSTFRIFFPISTRDREPAAEPSPQELRPVDGGTVLVVDDEEVVRQTASAALRKHGFEVLTAEDGIGALRLYESMSGAIDLVVLDLTMPDMDGESALEELRRLNPAARILLSTGYSLAEVTARFEGRGLAGYLQKPYTAARLIEAVRTAIRGTSAAQTS